MDAPDDCPSNTGSLRFSSVFYREKNVVIEAESRDKSSDARCSEK
jgi:hypothetical protein